MSVKEKKTEHAGPKRRTGSWESKTVVKYNSGRRRRQQDKEAISSWYEVERESEGDDWQRWKVGGSFPTLESLG